MLEDVQDGEFEFICLIGGNELSEIEIPFSESYWTKIYQWKVTEKSPEIDKKLTVLSSRFEENRMSLTWSKWGGGEQSLYST